MQQVLAERIIPRRGVLVDASLIIMGSLFVAAMAQLSIPLQPVPITGQTFAVLLVGMVLGSRRGTLALTAYWLEGLAGLPVFAGGQFGLTTILGPRGGYLVGFIVAAWLVGVLAERGFDRSLLKTLVAMVAGNIVIYAFGLAWLSSFPFISGLLGDAGLLTLGMTPFLAGDAIKAILAALLLPSAWKLVGKG